MEPDALMSRARRAYELGRLRRALELSAWVIPLATLSLIAGTVPSHALCLAILLFVIVTALAQRGEVYGRAGTFGLFLGGAVALLPVLARAVEPCCLGGTCGALCMPACVGGGVLAGALLGWRASREADRRVSFVMAAAATACLAGGFGCCRMIGMGGILGISLGVFVSAPSVLWLQTVRAR